MSILPIIIVEWIAFLCSFLLLAKGVPKKYWWFFAYCVFVFCIEYTSLWLLRSGKLSNHIVFNFAELLFDNFYLLSIRLFLVHKKNRQIVLAFSVAISIFWLVNVTFIQGINKLNTYTNIFGGILIIITCIIYYLELLTKESIVLLQEEPSFFIVSGYFIFSVLLSLIYTLHEYFAYRKTPVSFYRQAFNYTMQISNFALYLLLSVSFILLWTKRKL